MNIAVRIKRIIFVVGPALMIFSAPVRAGDDNIRLQFNEAIENIFLEIEAIKSAYPELEFFSKNAVSVDQEGYKTLFYVHESSANAPSGEDPYAYRFSIGLERLDNSAETENWNGSSDVKFPLLGVKVVVDAHRKGEWASFDLRRIVENNLDGLRSLEQEFLPFRLNLITDKQSYVVSEEISLIITLKNMGLKPYKVAELDESALYCSIGDYEWGNFGGEFELTRVLKRKGEIQKLLRITAPETPRELSIWCSYALGYKGVQPYQRIKVSILPKK